MIRVEITRTRGSSPREAGAAMFVAPDSLTGTIGGGQLEYMAIDRARQMIARGETEARMDAPYIGMIGSRTKLVQFRRFARAQGLDTDRLTCPIGAGWSRDKRPEVIAAFTAAEIIGRLTETVSPFEKYPCDS